MGNEEERDKKREEWLKSILNINKKFKKLLGEEEDEYIIYMPLVFPSGSTPPNANWRQQSIWDIPLHNY